MSPIAARNSSEPDSGLVSRFLESIQEPSEAYISPIRFAERAGLELGELAQIASVHRNTIRANPGSTHLQHRLREMAKVIAAAVDATGDISKALYWFRNEPISDYRFQTAAELVADGKAAAVLAYLEDLKNGAAG